MSKKRIVQSTVKRGIILIMALWALSFLSIFGLYLGYGARQKIILVKRITERDSLRLISEAGVKKALLVLSRDDTSSLDSFQEERLNSQDLFRGVKVGLGTFNLCYNYAQGAEEKEICGVIDEARKININKADRATMQRLFKAVLGTDDRDAQNIAASIVDFRDKNSTLSVPLGSAENSYYTNLREPYECKDAFFEVIDELLLVRGIDQDIFDKIKNFVTIYDEETVNVNTASYEVLSALGIPERILRYIIEYRQGDDGEEATADDNIFNAPQSIVPSLSQHYSLSIGEVALLSNLISKGLLATGSDYFMIRSQAVLTYSSATGEIICVVDREGKIIFWREM